MQEQFKAAFTQLNAKQKHAVTTTEGPVLVLAGPGTGKTQLLGTRAAYIVSQGAVGPANILCLTYTDTAASEMRERLGKIMGPSGGDVIVHTFHSFGTWIINQYPEYFSAQRSKKPLAATKLLRSCYPNYRSAIHSPYVVITSPSLAKAQSQKALRHLRKLA
jgi:superfamily I DNA/RNA helicase